MAPKKNTKSAKSSKKRSLSSSRSGSDRSDDSSSSGGSSASEGTILRNSYNNVISSINELKKLSGKVKKTSSTKKTIEKIRIMTDCIKNGGNSSSDCSETPTRKKRAKRIVDENAPKAPLQKYILFTMDKREQVVKENPEAKPKDITRLLGSMWKSLSEKEKEKYAKQADQLKAQYKIDLEAYEKSKK